MVKGFKPKGTNPMGTKEDSKTQSNALLLFRVWGLGSRVFSLLLFGIPLFLILLLASLLLVIIIIIIFMLAKPDELGRKHRIT